MSASFSIQFSFKSFCCLQDFFSLVSWWRNFVTFNLLIIVLHLSFPWLSLPSLSPSFSWQQNSCLQMQSKTTTEEEHTWQIWPIHPVSLNYLQVSRKQLHNTSNFSHQTTHLHYHLLCCPLLCHCLLRCLLPHKQMPGMNFSVVREEASVQIISFSTIIIIMLMMKSKENELLLCKQCCL